MSWIDAFLQAYHTIQIAASSMPQRSTVNFASGATAVDDPVNDRTVITVTGGGGGANAVTFGGANGNGPPANIGGNRTTQQSPLDATKVGIVNLSSDTSGTSPGVLASYGTIVGGNQNTISAVGSSSSILGGLLNSALSAFGFIGGGQSNIINMSSDDSVVCGGQGNSLADQWSFVGGGQGNSITVGGGWGVVCGGTTNSVNASVGAIVGGQGNSVAVGASFAFIGGGITNLINGGAGNTVNGSYGTVPGGTDCTAGGDFSTAFGNTCTASGADSVAGGNLCSAVGGDAIALGAGCLAVGQSSTALGNGTAAYSFGQLSHTSSNQNSQWGHLVYGAQGASGATPAVLKNANGTEWLPTPGAGSSTGTYRVTVRAVSDSSAATPSSFERSLTLRLAAGVLSILDTFTVHDYSPNGETLAISVTGGTLHLTFTGVAGTYNVAGEIDWVQALT